MTEAYFAGFSKTAEAYGVDPEKLIKIAGQVNWSPVLNSALMSSLLSGGGTLAVNKGRNPGLAGLAAGVGALIGGGHSWLSQKLSPDVPTAEDIIELSPEEVSAVQRLRSKIRENRKNRKNRK